jgi:hypothetical protein
MLKHVSVLGWIVIAILLIDAGLELRRQDLWGAARTIFIVVLFPYVTRPKRSEHQAPRADGG